MIIYAIYMYPRSNKICQVRENINIISVRRKFVLRDS